MCLQCVGCCAAEAAQGVVGVFFFSLGRDAGLFSSGRIVEVMGGPFCVCFGEEMKGVVSELFLGDELPGGCVTGECEDASLVVSGDLGVVFGGGRGWM